MGQPGRGEDVSDAAIIAVLERLPGRVSTEEVAAELPIKERQTRKRLRELERDGRVRATEIGNALLWSLD